MPESVAWMSTVSEDISEGDAGDPLPPAKPTANTTAAALRIAAACPLDPFMCPPLLTPRRRSAPATRAERHRRRFPSANRTPQPRPRQGLHARRRATADVVVDPFGAVVPLGAGIAERADELLLLDIDADDRDVVGGAALAQFGDVLELLVAIRMRGPGALLVVDAQRESHLLEEPGDGARADVGAELSQFGGDLGGRAACPLQAADRVAGRLMVHQGFSCGQRSF